MNRPRLPVADPRTLAREIPGLLEPLFPHLISGVVATLNHHSKPIRSYQPVELSEVKATKLSRSMLFELAIARAEDTIGRAPPDWSASLRKAVGRQKRHFDAEVPRTLTEQDKAVAERVAQNTLRALADLQEDKIEQRIQVTPRIPGCQWIASGVGDFSIGTRLVEVKCANRNFSSADYRQVLIYWILSYAAAVEGRGFEWTHVALSNPRLGHTVNISFDRLISLLAGGKSKIELLQLFRAIVSERGGHIQ